MARRSTRDALLEEGALLFARRGVGAVTARELHAAVGARNESALHYHFGSRDGLVGAIVVGHVEAVEERRTALVRRLEADGRTGDLRALVAALARPMADDLATPLGRAHLRLVAQLSLPSLAYRPPFSAAEAPSGAAVVGWITALLADLPGPVRVERLAALRTQLIGLFAFRAQLHDDSGDGEVVGTDELFVENVVDLLVAGLAAPPSPETRAALPPSGRRGPGATGARHGPNGYH